MISSLGLQRSLGVMSFEEWMKSIFQMKFNGRAHVSSWPTSQCWLLNVVTVLGPDIMFAVVLVLVSSHSKASHFKCCQKNFYDSDYAGASLDRKSTTRGCQFLSRDSLLAMAKSKPIVATSTTEAVLCSAASCCGQCKEYVYLGRLKHIAIRHHFIRDAYEEETHKGKNSLVKHFEDMRLCRPSKEYLQVWFNPPRDGSMSCLTSKGMHTIGPVCARRFRESLIRVTDGAEAFLILTLFILCLDKVSTDHAKLVPLGKVCTAKETLEKNTAKGTKCKLEPLISLTDDLSLLSNMAALESCRQLANISVPLYHFPVNSLTSKVFSFMIKKGKHFSGKVTPLFDTMLVQPTQDEGASSERLSDEQPSPSPAPTSEIPNESLPNSSSAQPSENLGDHSSNDTSLSGNEDEMTLQNVYDLCISLCQQQRFPRKSFSKKHRMHKKSVSKQGRKIAKGESSVQRDPQFDVIPEDKIDHMETENAQSEGRTRDLVDEDKEFDEDRLSTEDGVSTDKEGVSTDFEKVSTDRPIVSTDGSKVSTDEQVEGTEEHNEGTEEIFEGTEQQREGTEEKVESTAGQIKGTEDQTKEEIASQASQTSTQTPTSMIFGDDETIATLLLNMSQAKAASKEKEKGVELKDKEFSSKGEEDKPRESKDEVKEEDEGEENTRKRKHGTRKKMKSRKMKIPVTRFFSTVEHSEIDESDEDA
ncbi:hypothetical protein Tco_0272198 [Tanacetum coccineum]